MEHGLLPFKADLAGTRSVLVPCGGSDGDLVEAETLGLLSSR